MASRSVPHVFIVQQYRRGYASQQSSFALQQVSLTPIKDRLGFVTHFVAVLSDITERKASEAAFQLRDHALSNLNEVRRPVLLSNRHRVCLSDLCFFPK